MTIAIRFPAGLKQWAAPLCALGALVLSDVSAEAQNRVGQVFQDRFTTGSGQGPEMVVLPSGSFTMGSPTIVEGFIVNSAGSVHQFHERPQRTVRIDYRLAVGRYEVTVDEYRAFVTETGHSASGGCRTYDGSQWRHTASASWQSPGFVHPRFTQSGNHPVTCVSWEDAQAYVSWLNRKTGLTGRPDRYRLPSEAEWEYAARAGTTTNYSFGDFAGQLGSHAWFRLNSGRHTHSVGGKRANAFGLYDMHGNVWERVEDCWNHSHEGAPSDGSPRITEYCYSRVIRGGSWHDMPHTLRSASRSSSYSGSADINGAIQPGSRDSTVGFRVARTLPN